MVGDGMVSREMMSMLSKVYNFARLTRDAIVNITYYATQKRITDMTKVNNNAQSSNILGSASSSTAIVNTTTPTYTTPAASTATTTSSYSTSYNYRYTKRTYTVDDEFPNTTEFFPMYPVDEELLLRVHKYQVSYTDDTQIQSRLIPLLQENAPNAVIETDSHNNIYITKGNANLYPCFAAHSDQVHSIVKDEHYHVAIANGVMYGFDSYIMEQVGTGSDDKAGVYVCIEALRHLDNVKVVIFSDEETGCQGSSRCDMSFFDDVTIVMQGDRYGNNEWITRSNGVALCGDDFIIDIMPILEEFGYHDSPRGTLTDVGELTLQNIGVVTANVAIGYVNQHTATEVLHVKSLERAMNLMFTVADMYSLYRAEYEVPTRELMRNGAYVPYGYGDYWDNDEWDYCNNNALPTDEDEDEELTPTPSVFGGVCALHHCSVLSDDAEDSEGPTLYYCPTCEDYLNEDELL